MPESQNALTREEKVERLMDRVGELASEGKVKQAVDLTNKNWEHLMDGERVRVFLLFIRLGIRLEDVSKERGVAVSRSVFQTSGTVDDVVRAGSLLYLLGAERELSDQHRIKASEAADQVFEVDEVRPESKISAAIIKARQGSTREDVRRALGVILDSAEALAIRVAVLPGVRRMFADAEGVKILDSALEKLEQLEDHAKERKGKNAMMAIHEEVQTLRRALAEHVEERGREAVEKYEMMVGHIEAAYAAQDPKVRMSSMQELENTYRDLFRSGKYDAFLNEHQRAWVECRMSCIAHVLKRQGEERNYLIEAVIALRRLEEEGPLSKDAQNLQKEIQERQKVLGLTRIGEEG